MLYDKILDISKRRGIAYPSFEIYGGVSGFYDYGPVGKRIKQNIEDVIREYYVIGENCFEVECPVLSPESIWIASGHVKNFSDVLTECSKCGEPYRADHLIEEHTKTSCVGLNSDELYKLIEKNKIHCPKCGGELEMTYPYNLMFQTSVGAGKDKTTAYLRPETAQMTYLPFKRLYEIGRKHLPLGVLQIGHSFRNEISPRQGMIRLREFNQAEIQFFVDPENKKNFAPQNFCAQSESLGSDSGKKSENFDRVSGIIVKMLTKDNNEFEISLGEAVEKGIIKIQMIAYFLGISLRLFEEIGINKNLLKLRQHKDDERAFYSTDTWDIEFTSSIGRIEIVGISDRTDYDLSAHMKLSRQNMEVNHNGKNFVPHVIEVAYGIDRPIYCIMESCYTEENDRIYFKFPKRIAPYRLAVFPLVNKDNIPEKAVGIFEALKKNRTYAIYDDSGSIGRRYARADEIGIPECITVDYQSLEDNTVTVRDRDTKGQVRVKADEILGRLRL